MTHPSSDDVLDRYAEVLESLGAETVAHDLMYYLPTDDVPEFNLGDFAEWLSRNYDL